MKISIVCVLSVFAAISIGRSDGDSIWRADLPSVFKRNIKIWSADDACSYERIKSLALNVSGSWINNEPGYSVQTILPIGDHDVKKVECVLEFQDLPRKRAAKLKKRKLMADVLPLENLKSTAIHLVSSNVLANANILELTFDITALYNASRLDLLEEIKFNVKILRKSGKLVKSLRKKNVKAFVLVYEKIDSCNFMDFLPKDGRFRRSIDFQMANSSTKIELKSAVKSELCLVKEMEIDFNVIEMDWILHPESYNRGMCGGMCSIRNYRTGYQLMESLVSGGQLAACQPIEFGSMAIIYMDHSDKRPVISKFNEMVVKQCGCT